MLLYMPYDITPGKWHDIYWLLTEWRTSSATIQAASTPSEKQELLKKRYLLKLSFGFIFIQSDATKIKIVLSLRTITSCAMIKKMFFPQIYAART
jgi:hypothetical protein